MLHRVPIISFNQSALLFLFQGCRDRVPTPPNKQKKATRERWLKKVG
jgi:hypothetical protein